MHADSKEGAFANLNAWKGVATFAFYATSSITCVKVKLIVLIVLFALALPTLVAAETAHSKSKTTQTDEEIQVTENLNVTSEQ